jgi:hypothetical protein
LPWSPSGWTRRYPRMRKITTHDTGIAVRKLGKAGSAAR